MYYYDTYCTLNFATKSKKIVNNTCTRETIGKCLVVYSMGHGTIMEFDEKKLDNHGKMEFYEMI